MSTKAPFIFRIFVPVTDFDQAIAFYQRGERSFYARDPFGNGLCFVDENTLFTGPSSLAV